MDDEQPRIAILGGGPISLEAALYARYLGYPTQVFERSENPAASVLAQGDQVVGTFGELASRLGVSALRAQNVDWQLPSANSVLTAAAWHARYLVPLAESDLVAEVLQLGCEVVDVTRRDTEEDVAFEIRCRDAARAEATHEADIVIDATGANSPAWFGDSGADEGPGFGNPEADFYMLGAKGGAKSFAAALGQIRDLFAVIGEREDLDVYATMPAIA
jgi:hypothetical protein